MPYLVTSAAPPGCTLYRNAILAPSAWVAPAEPRNGIGQLFIPRDASVQFADIRLAGADTGLLLPGHRPSRHTSSNEPV